MGFMQVTAENVGEHGMIGILALCFNATGHALDLQRIEGQVKVTEFKDGKQIEVGKLPRPWFNSTTDPTCNIPNLMEFMVVLEQPVPPEIGSRFRELQGNQGLSLELNELQVFVSLHEAPQQAVRLPLWGGIMVRRTSENLQSSRVLFLTGALVEG